MASPVRRIKSLIQKIAPTKEEPKTLIFREIGWKITIPKLFNLLNEEETTSFINSEDGKGSIFENGIEPSPKILFIGQAEAGNFFHCHIIPLQNNINDEFIAEHMASSKEKLIDFYRSKWDNRTGITVKTITDSMQICDIEFESLDIVVSTREEILHQNSSYYKVYSGHYISICAAFSTDETGKEMFRALLDSKFE